MLSLRGTQCVETALADLALDYQVEKHQLACRGTDVPRWALFRGDEYLTHVGSKYEVVQNSELFGFMDPLVASGRMQVFSGGAGRGGKNVWMLFTTDNRRTVKDDEIQLNILVKSSHGSGALKIGIAPYRFVCSNTLSSISTKGFLSMNHDTRMRDKLRTLTDWLDDSVDAFGQTLQWYSMLGRSHCPEAKLTRFLEVFKIPMDHENRYRACVNWWEVYNKYNSYLQHNTRVGLSSRMNTLFFTTKDRRALRYCLSA